VFTLIKSVSTHDLLLRLTPTFVASLVIAELFYKFGSFSLECVAFLATWGALDAASHLVTKKKN
jgi:hypothetical protein